MGFEQCEAATRGWSRTVLYRQLCPAENLELICHSEERGEEESVCSCKNTLEILRSAQNDNQTFPDEH